MSSAASPNSIGQSVTGQSVENSSAKNNSSAKTSLRTPPARPQLMGPPSRPQPPAAPAPASVPTPEPEVPSVIGPISAPSERMQYRAIGMLKGKYIASEEQFNRGNIAVEDGSLVDAVLLGRVTSLIKKHVDLETDHVWVVYPRTLYSEENEPALHVQIVGVWEPETLNGRNGDTNEDNQDSDDDSEDKPRYLSTAEAAQQCDRFSIRGEIAKYDEEKEEITVNIVQKSKSENVKPKRPFKLLINGKLTGRTVGYFWDLEVEREEGKLILQSSKPIAVVPPKKKSKKARKDTRRRVGKPRGSAAKPVPKPKTAEKKAAAGTTEQATQNGVVKTGSAIEIDSSVASDQPSQVEVNTQASDVQASAEAITTATTENHAKPTKVTTPASDTKETNLKETELEGTNTQETGDHSKNPASDSDS